MIDGKGTKKFNGLTSFNIVFTTLSGFGWQWLHCASRRLVFWISVCGDHAIGSYWSQTADARFFM